jgi:uncharacterized protein
MDTFRRDFLAYTLPFIAFMVFLALSQWIGGAFKESGNFLLAQPQYWMYPLQTVVCAGILAWFWKRYPFPVKGILLGFVGGIVALVIWISPQLIFGAAPRTDGFNPEVFIENPTLYWLTVIARFARLVIVVSLLEEIFWRGFLMRYLIDEKFTSIPFGTYKPFAFFGTALGFMLVHQPSDYIAAFLTGLIYNGLAVKTKSLLACVVAHATTNLLLGFYIMGTKQWGFW